MSPSISRRAVLAALGATALAGAPSAAAALPARAGALARGFNLPDQVPLKSTARPDPSTLKWLRRRGMTHVRLPVFGEAVMSRFADRATIARTLDDLDRALNLLLGLDYFVSVDMHPGDAFGRLHSAEPEAALSTLTEAWSMLAPSISRRPTERVLAELLNEPHTTDAIWREQAERLTLALRANLPSTTLVVGPAPYQRVEALAAWRPLSDPNIIYAFHYYDPMLFTHQGMTWDAANPLSRLAGVPYPTSRDDPRLIVILKALRARGETELVDDFERALARPWTKATIEAQFAPLAAWAADHQVAVILNEFGVLRFKASRASRLAWLHDVRACAQANGFGWAHWDYRSGFGLLDESGRPDAAVIEALLPTSKGPSPRRSAL